LVVVLAGCGGGYGSSSSGGSTQASSGGNVIKTIHISEKEYSLTPSSVKVSKAGTYTFKATNDGSITHAFEVEGNGVEAKTGNINPDSSATLHITLKAGSYEMYCPVDGHKQEGMKGGVTVGSTGGGGGMTTNERTTTSRGGGYGY
jgi:uncharacterized cupredoxin-like copper-binding protein